MPVSRLKVLTIFGTRPEVIKRFPVIARFEGNERFHSTVASTSQHREMIDDLISLFSLRFDHDLNICNMLYFGREFIAQRLGRLHVLKP